MASYIYTASGSSQLSDQIQTDKVRIAAISPMAFAVGDANVVANTTSCEIIPGGVVERSITVGQGNYIAFIGIGVGTHEPFSVTELGAPHPETGTE